MSFDIQGVGAAQSSYLRAINGGEGSSAAAGTSGIEAEDEAVAVRTMPVAPPAEVMDAISVAAGASDQLEASGQQLRFGLDASSGRLTIQLQDLDGNTLSTLKPSHVLALADGASPNN